MMAFDPMTMRLRVSVLGKGILEVLKGLENQNVTKAKKRSAWGTQNKILPKLIRNR